MKLGKAMTGLVKRISAKLSSDSYIEYYQKSTKTDSDWKELIGSRESFEAVRDWQFYKVMEYGLTPDAKLLDIGCGVLRGGIPFIKYLNAGNYFGMDINTNVLKVATDRISEEGLVDEKPVIFRNKNLRFDDYELKGEKFDYILAQSVFTHLPPKNVQECLANIHKVLKGDAVFLATFNRAFFTRRAGAFGILGMGTDFRYNLDWFEKVCERYDLKVEQVFSGHPVGQELLKIQRRPTE